MIKDILIDRDDVTMAIGLINLAREHGTIYDKWNFSNYLGIGCCGWAKAPRAWYIRFKISDKAWYDVLKMFKEHNVTLLPETTGY